MISIPAHFDGSSIVLDEPVSLSVGQQVTVVVDSSPTTPPNTIVGLTKGMIESVFSPHADSTAELMYGESYDERDVLHIKPLDAVPSDFVRHPGSGAGEIRMADDFDETPDDFKEYL